MMGPQIRCLSGDRLHLHHGPIDLILWAEGAQVAQAYAQAIARFEYVLEELVAELDDLRDPVPGAFNGPIAQAMGAATVPLGLRLLPRWRLWLGLLRMRCWRRCAVEAD